MIEDAKIAETRNTWEAAAPGWSKWEQTFSQGMEPVTDVPDYPASYTTRTLA